MTARVIVIIYINESIKTLPVAHGFVTIPPHPVLCDTNEHAHLTYGEAFKSMSKYHCIIINAILKFIHNTRFKAK